MTDEKHVLQVEFNQFVNDFNAAMKAIKSVMGQDMEFGRYILDRVNALEDKLHELLPDKPL